MALHRSAIYYTLQRFSLDNVLALFETNTSPHYYSSGPVIMPVQQALVRAGYARSANLTLDWCFAIIALSIPHALECSPSVLERVTMGDEVL